MSSLQRVVGVVIVSLALVIGIVPALYNCAARGRYLSVTAISSTATPAAGMGTATTGGMKASTGTTMTGGAASGSTLAATVTKVPMKCFYTAKAGVAMGIPLGILGLLVLVSRRKETNRVLAVLGIVLGGVAMAVPTVLIGTCGKATMICNEVLKPTMLFAGGAVIVLSVIVLVLGERKGEPTLTSV